MDRLEYEGEWNIVTPVNRPWLDLLENERTKAIRLQARCSAIGTPRAEWRISDNRLWLVGLFGCGPTKFELETVYGGNGNPIFAEWITADLVMQRGKSLCFDRYGGIGILESTVVFKVKHGMVIGIAQFSNKEHPAVPTVEDLRKLLAPIGKEQEAEAIVAVRDWPCLDTKTQQELRGRSYPVSPTRGNTLGEYFDEHAKKLLEK